MKQLHVLLFFYLFSFNLYSSEIGTIKLSKIINNSDAYTFFINDFEDTKKKIFDDFKNIEDRLNSEKKDIESSKIILSQEEYDKRVGEFNLEAKNFQIKVDNINKKIENYLESNKATLINEVASIVKKISQDKNIDIVFNENNYFLSNSNLDITDLVIENLNNMKIEFSQFNFNTE